MMIKVFGDGLDALISINLLLNSGCKVLHFTNSEQFGGHFRGIETCGEKFDLGMVLLEPDFTPGLTKNFKMYEGEFGRNARPYLHETYTWLESKIGGFIKHNVKTLLPSHGEIPDYFIGDNLDFLKTLNEEQVINLETRLISILKDSAKFSEIHPANRFESEKASQISLQDFLIKVYGMEIYETYFKGFLHKIAGTESSVSSRDNRRVWMPNYYPESILNALRNHSRYSKYDIRPIEFLRPEKNQIAEFVFRIQTENEMNRNYHREKFYLNQFDFEDPNSIYFLTLMDFSRIYETDLSFLNEFTKNTFEKTFIASSSINVTHFCVAECASETIFFPEKNNSILRYSSYSSSLQKNAVSIESIPNLDDPKELASDLLKNKAIETTCEGYTKNFAFKVVKTPFSISDWGNFLMELKSNLLNINRNIFLIHPEANTLNDNLIRGLVAFRMRDLSDS